MKRFKDILCAVTGGKAYKTAIDRAVTLAENNQAKLTVVEVAARVTSGIGMPPGGPISATLQDAMGFIMGNTAETILNRIESSVLAIKPPDFTTPVTVED